MTVAVNSFYTAKLNIVPIGTMTDDVIATEQRSKSRILHAKKKEHKICYPARPNLTCLALASLEI